jgi:hypothetical protein
LPPHLIHAEASGHFALNPYEDLAVQSERSPLSPAALTQLFFRPSRYFYNHPWLLQRPEAVFVAWVVGIAYAIGRVDSNIIKMELGAGHHGWAAVGPWLTGSWAHYWAFLLVSGAINGATFWYLGGWWYRKRLHWSGARDVYRPVARGVYVYQDFVQSAPIVFIALVQSFKYKDYMNVWRAEEWWSSLSLLFVFWSCGTSYMAARTFPVSKWKARFWFFVLPVLFYFIVLGLIGTRYGLTRGESI